LQEGSIVRLFVPLSMEEFDRLLDLAHRERRRIQDEAAVLLIRALDALDAPPPAAGLADADDRADAVPGGEPRS
jgi:hypothetical protein